MVTCSPTRMRSGLSVIDPLLAVEEEVDGTVAPDEDMLAALAEGAVQPALGDPLINGLHTQAEQAGQLGRGDDDRAREARRPAKRPGDLFLAQRPLARAHCLLPARASVSPGLGDMIAENHLRLAVRNSEKAY